MEQNCSVKSGGGIVLKAVAASPEYQAELKKLQKHYGIRATLDSYEQAAWDKEGAITRLDPCNELWLKVEAAMDIIGADFAIWVHTLLERGMTAEAVILKLGKFRDYLKSELSDISPSILLFGEDVCRELRRIKKHWWKVYHGGAEDVE